MSVGRGGGRCVSTSLQTAKTQERSLTEEVPLLGCRQPSVPYARRVSGSRGPGCHWVSADLSRPKLSLAVARRSQAVGLRGEAGGSTRHGRCEAGRVPVPLRVQPGGSAAPVGRDAEAWNEGSRRRISCCLRGEGSRSLRPLEGAQPFRHCRAGPLHRLLPWVTRDRVGRRWAWENMALQSGSPPACRGAWDKPPRSLSLLPEGHCPARGR